MNREAELQAIVEFFESMTEDSVCRLERIYAPDAFFKDPFNEVHGLASIAAIFTDMFKHVEQPRFVVTARVAQGDEAFLTWDFLFVMKRFSRAQQCIRGASHLRFGADGLVHYHRDYWDAAEELYEKLPLLGGFMRMLKRAGKA